MIELDVNFKDVSLTWWDLACEVGLLATDGVSRLNQFCVQFFAFKCSGSVSNKRKYWMK